MINKIDHDSDWKRILSSLSGLKLKVVFYNLQRRISSPASTLRVVTGAAVVYAAGVIRVIERVTCSVHYDK